MKIPTPTHSTLEDIEERIKEDDHNNKDLMFKQGSKLNSVIFLIVVFIVCFVFFYIGDSESFTNFVKKSEKKLKTLYKENYLAFWFIIFIAQFGGSITSVPTHVVNSVVTYYIVRDFMKCFLILCTLSIFGTFVCYLIYNCFYERIFKKMKNFPLTKILKAKAIKNPYLIGFLSRCLLISSGFNDYLVLLCEISFPIYMSTGIIYHILTTALFLVIGYKISTLKDIFSFEKWM